MATPENKRRSQSWIERVRERREQHKTRSRTYRVAFGTAGILFLLAGLLLSLPFVPGPGLLLVAVGLFMLALEFDRAERLLERVLVRLEQVSEQAARSGKRERFLALAVGLVTASALVVALALWDVPLIPGALARR